MVPEKMEVVICTRYVTPEVIKTKWANTPVPKPDELLIKVEASLVNSGDVRVRAIDASGFMKVMMRLLIGFNKPRRPVLGSVYAGTVAGVGKKIKRFNIGDGVYGLCGFNLGAHAE